MPSESGRFISTKRVSSVCLSRGHGRDPFPMAYCLALVAITGDKVTKDTSLTSEPAQRACSPPQLPLHLWSELVFIDAERKLTHVQISCGVSEGEREDDCLYQEQRFCPVVLFLENRPHLLCLGYEPIFQNSKIGLWEVSKKEA